MKKRNPGTGAIEFARPYVQHLEELDALSVIKSLLAGELHDSTDKRIKRCAYCDYYYRDNTRPNNSKVCSPECREARKVVERKSKRHYKNPPKPSRKDEYFLRMESGYDFWIQESEMLRFHESRETMFDSKKVEEIAAAKQRKVMLGGRKNPNYSTNYNGDVTGESTNHRIYNVRLVGNKAAKQPGEIISKRLDPAEVQAYLSDKYGEYKLRLERCRAEHQGRIKRD